MEMRWRGVVWSVLLGVAVGAAQAAPPTRMEDAEARKLFQRVQPPARELTFQEIPWRLTMLEALVEAQLKDKPILLWQKRGQPMGFV